MIENVKDWNPELYLKFRNERTQPSIDLVNRININFEPESIIDIGCGPGNSGQILFGRWPNAKFVGIDNSQKMIEKATSDYPDKSWQIADAATYKSETKFDIVYSNATIQWIPNHEQLLGRLYELLSARGILAIQLPIFGDMPIAKEIENTAKRSKWRKQTEFCSQLFTFHDYNFYYDILSGRFASIEMWETYYLHILESHKSIIEMTKSTGMKPYLDSLNNEFEREEFENDILTEIVNHYPVQSNGKVIFPFKRLFMIGFNKVQ